MKKMIAPGDVQQEWCSRGNYIPSPKRILLRVEPFSGLWVINDHSWSIQMTIYHIYIYIHHMYIYIIIYIYISIWIYHIYLILYIWIQMTIDIWPQNPMGFLVLSIRIGQAGNARTRKISCDCEGFSSESDGSSSDGNRPGWLIFNFSPR